MFNTLTRQCLETALPPRAKAGEGFDALIEAYFLVPEGKDECAFYESISDIARITSHRKGISGYTILPTLGCNARCTYCYEEGRAQMKMQPETVEATLRYILEHHVGRKESLHWFGGEPLLCPDIIDSISSGLREAGVPYKSAFVSNGSLITPAVIEKMLGLWNTKNIQISLDGAETDYIARKRYYSDFDAYHAVMDSISRLSEAGISVSLRVNVDEGNWPGIPQFMDDLKRGVWNKEKVKVYFSPLMDVRTGENDLAFWKKVLAAYPLITEAGFQRQPFVEPSTRLRVNHCMADGGGVVIGPDGGLYPCEHCTPESRYGDVFRGTTDADVEHEFRRADRTREKCKACPMLPQCTSFAACPWTDRHCREVREMLAVAALQKRVRTKAAEHTEDDDLSC